MDSSDKNATLQALDQQIENLKKQIEDNNISDQERDIIIKELFSLSTYRETFCEDNFKDDDAKTAEVKQQSNSNTVGLALSQNSSQNKDQNQLIYSSTPQLFNNDQQPTYYQYNCKQQDRNRTNIQQNKAGKCSIESEIVFSDSNKQNEIEQKQKELKMEKEKLSRLEEEIKQIDKSNTLLFQSKEDELDISRVNIMILQEQIEINSQGSNGSKNIWQSQDQSNQLSKNQIEDEQRKQGLLAKSIPNQMKEEIQYNMNHYQVNNFKDESMINSQPSNFYQGQNGQALLNDNLYQETQTADMNPIEDLELVENQKSKLESKLDSVCRNMENLSINGSNSIEIQQQMQQSEIEIQSIMNQIEFLNIQSSKLKAKQPNQNYGSMFSSDSQSNYGDKISSKRGLSQLENESSIPSQIINKCYFDQRDSLNSFNQPDQGNLAITKNQEQLNTQRVVLERNLPSNNITIYASKREHQQKGFVDDIFRDILGLSFLRYDLINDTDIITNILNYKYKNNLGSKKIENIAYEFLSACLLNKEVCNQNGLSINEKNYFRKYSQILKEYLNLRNMNIINIFQKSAEENINSLFITSSNEKEVLITELYVRNGDVKYKLLVDYQGFYLDMIANQQSQQEGLFPQKKVRFCILPLRNINKINFCELDDQDIKQFQKGQTKNQIFRNSMVRWFINDIIYLNEQFKGLQQSLENDVNSIAQKGDIQLIQKYLILDNSENTLVQNDCKDPYARKKGIENFKKFYYTHILLYQKLKNTNLPSHTQQIVYNLLSQLEPSNYDDILTYQQHNNYEEQFEQTFKECQELYEIQEKLEKEKIQSNQKEIKQLNSITLSLSEQQKSDQIKFSIQTQQISEADQNIQNKLTLNQVRQQQQNECLISEYQNQNSVPKSNIENSKRDDSPKTIYYYKQGEQIDLQQMSCVQQPAYLSIPNLKEFIKTFYSQNTNDYNFHQKNNLDDDIRNFYGRSFQQNINGKIFDNSNKYQQQNYSNNFQNLNKANMKENNFSQYRTYNQRGPFGKLNEKRRLDDINNSYQQQSNDFYQNPSKKIFRNENQTQNQFSQKRDLLRVFYDRDSNYNVFDNNPIQIDLKDQFQQPSLQNEKKEQENISNQESRQQLEGNQNHQIQNSIQDLNCNQKKQNENQDNQDTDEDNQDITKLKRKSNDVTILVNQQAEQLKKKGFVKDSLCFIQYLKYLINPIAGINSCTFSEENYQISMKQDKGISVHRYVADLFRNNQYILKFCNSLSQNQQKFLQHYVQVVKDYISIRGMQVKGVEAEFKSEGEIKRYDLLAENEKEALIFDWKFTQQDAYYKILVDYQEHFLNQVRVLQQIYTNKIVRICILPLQEIKQIKFIEFEYQDIQQIQMNQAKDFIFQKSMLKMFLEELKKEPKLKDDYSYNTQGQAITIQQQVEKIIQEEDIQQIEYYIDLNNSDELLFKQNSQNSFKKIVNKKQFNQFYYIHLILCQKLSINNKLQLNEKILHQIQKTMKDTNQITQKNDLKEEIISNNKEQQQLPQSFLQSPQSFKSLPNSYLQSPQSQQWSPQSLQQIHHPFQQSPSPLKELPQFFEQSPSQYQNNPSAYNQYQQNHNSYFDLTQPYQQGENKFNRFKQQGSYNRQYTYGNQHFFDKR
ncbi:hypothetical protein ABPG72_021496 [Tetrahymena utriculariae]